MHALSHLHSLTGGEESVMILESEGVLELRHRSIPR